MYWKILKPSFQRLGNSLPRLCASQFGWLVAGDKSVGRTVDSTLALTSEDVRISHLIEQLWLMGDEQDNSNLPSEEIDYKNYFLQTCRHDASGRFLIRLPLKRPREDLGRSKLMTIQRFYLLEPCFQRDKAYEAYCDCINNYLEQGHMCEACDSDHTKISFYAHHPVLKHFTSTKCLPVFDFSAASDTDVSLNHLPIVGPVIQSDLLSILLRSPTYNFIFSADIVQMYRQVKVHPSVTPFQRIIWCNSPNKPLNSYEFKIVPFWLASAPYLATRCLKQLAEKAKKEYSAAKVPLL